MDIYDELGRHVADDGRRKLKTVLGILDQQNRRSYERDWRSGQDKNTTTGIIRLYGELPVDIAEEAIRGAYGNLTVANPTPHTHHDAVTNGHAYLLDYLDSWRAYPESQYVGIGRDPADMTVEEMLFLLVEESYRLKWLAPALYAHPDIKFVEEYVHSWVVLRRDEIDIELTLKEIQASPEYRDPMHRYGYGQGQSYRYTCIEEALGYEGCLAADPFTGVTTPYASRELDDSTFPYHRLPRRVIMAVQWGVAAQYPAIEALATDPSLLFSPPTKQSYELKRLFEAYDEAPERDQQQYGHFPPSAILPDHPSYPMMPDHMAYHAKEAMRRNRRD